MNLRTSIGKYIARDGAKLTKNALTLHDLGELIRRAGLDAGFIVESQFDVVPAHGHRNVRKIDWVWLHKSKPLNPVVAFEIEGRDAHPDSIERDVSRLKDSQTKLKVIALYQVDHNRTMMKMPPYGWQPKNWVRRHAGKAKIAIMLDEELMARDGIEKLVRDALTRIR